MYRRSLLGMATAAVVLLAACASSRFEPPDASVDATVDVGIDGTDACAPGPEQCNGRDDDCDQEADEDFPTVGDACMVGVGPCERTGHLRCTADGAGVECDVTAGTPGVEVCNAADDDCDGSTDEGFGVGGLCDGVDADLCREGMIQCAANGTTACSDATGDNVETCNGLNDDCDGATDEGFGLGAMCDGADADLCREGMVVCAAGGGTTCSDTSANNLELCNAMDDDCDLMTDEGLGLGTPCDGADTDSCVEGTRICAAGGGTTCSDTTSSTVEVCNGLDDDCAAGIDNGFAVGATCTVGVGACARTGTNVCNAGGNGVVCSATAGAATAELCGDGVDQDCNGADVACPVNDGPTAAIDISAGGTFTVDLSTARNDQELIGPDCGAAGGRDVFYRFSLPAAEVVYVDTLGSSFDSVIRIFPGACTAPPATQTCLDDQCGTLQGQGAVQLAAGSYCLLVDQFSSNAATGALVLNFVRGGRTGTAIATGTGTQPGTTVGATNQTGPGCTTSSAPDQAYFALLCPGAHTIGANTCTGTTWDTAIYARKGPASSADLVCADDSSACAAGSLQSSFSGTSVAGPGLLWLIVDGYMANTGAYSLNYTIN